VQNRDAGPVDLEVVRVADEVPAVARSGQGDLEGLVPDCRIGGLARSAQFALGGELDEVPLAALDRAQWAGVQIVGALRGIPPSHLEARGRLAVQVRRIHPRVVVGRGDQMNS